MDRDLLAYIGWYFKRRSLRQARYAERGIYQAARNLRKQGIPLAIALLLLTGSL